MNVNKNIFILDSKKVIRGMIHVGSSKLPIFPTKGVSTLIRLSADGRINIKGTLKITVGCSVLSSYNGIIEFGNNVHMNMGVLMYRCSKITINNHVRIGWKVQIYDTNFHLMADVNTGEVRRPDKVIVIVNNVWFGNHATIGPGAQIPAYTAVAAHSLVKEKIFGYS